MVFVRAVCNSRMKIPCDEPGDETHQAKILAGLDVLCEGRNLIKHESKRSSTLACSQVHRMRGREESDWCCTTSS